MTRFTSFDHLEVQNQFIIETHFTSFKIGMLKCSFILLTQPLLQLQILLKDTQNISKSLLGSSRLAIYPKSALDPLVVQKPVELSP